MFEKIKRWFRKPESIPYDSVVDLEEALTWQCEICGRRNYVDYVPMEPGSDELKDIKQHNESEDGQLIQVEPGDCQRAPYTVQCGKCSHVFAVGNHYSDLA